MGAVTDKPSRYGPRRASRVYRPAPQPVYSYEPEYRYRDYRGEAYRTGYYGSPRPDYRYRYGY